MQGKWKGAKIVDVLTTTSSIAETPSHLFNANPRAMARALTSSTCRATPADRFPGASGACAAFATATFVPYSLNPRELEAARRKKYGTPVWTSVAVCLDGRTPFTISEGKVSTLAPSPPREPASPAKSYVFWNERVE